MGRKLPCPHGWRRDEPCGQKGGNLTRVGGRRQVEWIAQAMVERRVPVVGCLGLVRCPPGRRVADEAPDSGTVCVPIAVCGHDAGRLGTMRLGTKQPETHADSRKQTVKSRARGLDGPEPPTRAGGRPCSMSPSRRPTKRARCAVRPPLFARLVLALGGSLAGQPRLSNLAARAAALGAKLAEFEVYRHACVVATALKSVSRATNTGKGGGRRKEGGRRNPRRSTGKLTCQRAWTA